MIIRDMKNKKNIILIIFELVKIKKENVSCVLFIKISNGENNRRF